MSFEAFILLTLPVATLDIGPQSHSGPFELKCVSLAVEGGKAMQEDYPFSHQKIYLVVRVRGKDTPIDSSRSITFSYDNAARSYVFGTADGNSGTLLLPTPSSNEAIVLEDQNTFHGILAQYTDLEESTSSSSQIGTVPEKIVSHEVARGRLVFVDDDTGEVVGELDNKLLINEDPALNTPGAEDAPVVIEIANDAQEVFARVILPEERDWITNSATRVRYVLSLPCVGGYPTYCYACSRVISGTTKLVLTTITNATDHYIAHSKPNIPASAKGPALPRALIFLTSENAHKGLSTVYALSAQAATVSSQSVGFVDSMIKCAIRGKQKNPPGPTPYRLSSQSSFPSTTTSSEVLPPSYSPSIGPKPPLHPPVPSPSSSTFSHSSSSKPPLPPRQDSPSEHAYPLTPSSQPATVPGMSTSDSPRPSLKIHHRLALSADLILDTMSSSMKRIVSVGGDNLVRAIEHKYVICSLIHTYVSV